MNMLQNPTLSAFNASEYTMLFGLTDDDLTKKILDFPSGLNSFTADLSIKNKMVVGCDEIYHSPSQLEQSLKSALKSHQLAHRKEIIEKFDADFKKGFIEKRYIAGGLPKLPFKDYEFDLMLCSFFFFEKDETIENYWNKLTEMLRVATEVRIYPISMDKGPTNILGHLMLTLQTNGFGVEVRSVTFPGLPNSAVLRVWSQNCQL